MCHMDILQYEDYKKMELSLKYFRFSRDYLNIKSRLYRLPFNNSRTLFKVDPLFPCIVLGKQLVHKIVDELIYCGL